MSNGFEEERRFLLEDGKDVPAPGFDRRRVAVLITDGAHGLNVLVEDVRMDLVHYVPAEVRTVHCEKYRFTGELSDNVPAGLDQTYLEHVNALLFSSHAPAVTNILWILFYKLVIAPAVDDSGHWMNVHVPQFAAFHRRVVQERRNASVAEVMES